MFKTKNDLSESIRVKVVDLPNARLADAIDLQTQSKQAHCRLPRQVAFGRSSRSLMQVLAARATSLPLLSFTSHSM